MQNKNIVGLHKFIKEMKRIVLVRHGQSQWNKENRFTGWTNVDLSPQGITEAENAGKLLKQEGYTFDIAYTSYLKRAVKTLNCVLDKMDEDWIPVLKSWRLNEKHYGFLQGLNKSETAEKYGNEQVHIWRRSFDIAPKAMSEDNPDNPRHDARYAAVPPEYIPDTESLKDTIARVMPYWECEIFPRLMKADNILVVAHGNSLRGIVKHLKGISDDDISKLNIPTAVPYVFEFDDYLKLTKDFYLGDPEEIKRKQEAVAKQGLAK
jgi:2,3-bisphosphoglycerate-dependent phosphoglycerate mutase